MRLKNIIFILMGIAALVLIALFLVRTFTPEDNWICENGEWVRHGNPSSPMPVETCPVQEE